MSTELNANLDGQGMLFDLATENEPSKATDKSRRQRTSALRADDVYSSLSGVREAIQQLADRLAGVEATLRELQAANGCHTVVKEFYTTAEVAKLLGKRPYTVREWCRLARVRAEKTHAGRGLDEEWRIAHEELMRLQNEGLLPVIKPSQVAAPKRLPR